MNDQMQTDSYDSAWILGEYGSKARRYIRKSYPKLREFLRDFGYLHDNEDNNSDDKCDDISDVALDDKHEDNNAEKLHFSKLLLSVISALLPRFFAIY